MAKSSSEFVPWTKAFEAAGVKDIPGNARGYWGYHSGLNGFVVCSVWNENIQNGEATAYIPKVNKGRYREAAENLSVGNEVIVILRSRSTKLGKVLPTLWRVASKCLDEPTGDSIGFLLLKNTGTAL